MRCLVLSEVLEHIENDQKTLNDIYKKLNKDGLLFLFLPAFQILYSDMDEKVGHFRRYEKKFFKKDFQNLELLKVKHLDSIGLLLYYLNKIFFSKETSIKTITDELNKILEKMVIKKPDQWIWSHNRWK